jgi:hypothetical protein
MQQLQQIRRSYEAPIEAALASLTPPIRCYADNQYYDDDDATAEYAVCTLNFNQVSNTTIGICGDMELLRGELAVEIYTMKGTGPGRSQEAGEAVWAALMRLNRAVGSNARTGAVRGPEIEPLPGRPHYRAEVRAEATSRSGRMTAAG